MKSLIITDNSCEKITVEKTDSGAIAIMKKNKGNSQEERLRNALKADFSKLYVQEFTTAWELERLSRGIEIDIMSLRNTLALLSGVTVFNERETKELVEFIIS